MAAAASSAAGGNPPRPANRLAAEQSPYLLQHAHNLVDWHPWGPEALAKARRENKPILLSVGYSTCHWREGEGEGGGLGCHVMERESFHANPAVAALLNSHFVPIKVDKEERPDVDATYMRYVQATTGGGGWPLTVWLTPDLNPFLGGTYFPPVDSHGRPGFATLLQRVADIWEQKGAEVCAQAADATAQLAAAFDEPAAARGGGGGAFGAAEAGAAITATAESLASRFDRVHGGFGGAPKFPRPAELAALHAAGAAARAAGRAADAERADGMARTTLLAIAGGGIKDHLGGGISRYSVDELWHVPHFEIMLYDCAQLLTALTDAAALARAGGHPAATRLAGVARELADFVLRSLRHPGGGLFSALDADSLDEGAGVKREGWCYLWTEAEVDAALDAAGLATGPCGAPGGGPHALGAAFKTHYGVRPDGNCDRSPRSDPHGEFAGRNVLYEARSLADTAACLGVDEAEAGAALAACRAALHAVRAARPPPHLDDKVIAAWNGMAVSALAVAGRALAAFPGLDAGAWPRDARLAADYVSAAERAAAFVKAQLWDATTRRLRRSYRTRPSDVAGFADDYAWMAAACLDLHAATGRVAWLAWALELQAALDADFGAPDGAYYSTDGADPSVVARPVESYDGAEPAATSVAVANLMRLAALTSGERAAQYEARGREAAAAILRRPHADVASPQAAAGALLIAAWPLRQVVIAGTAGAADTDALLAAAHARYAPDKVVILIDRGDAEAVSFWEAHNPDALAVVGAHPPDGPATAFVCQNFTCKAPTADPTMLDAALAEPRRAPTARAAMTPVDLGKLGGNA